MRMTSQKIHVKYKTQKMSLHLSGKSESALINHMQCKFLPERTELEVICFEAIFVFIET